MDEKGELGKYVDFQYGEHAPKPTIQYEMAMPGVKNTNGEGDDPPEPPENPPENPPHNPPDNPPDNPPTPRDPTDPWPLGPDHPQPHVWQNPEFHGGHPIGGPAPDPIPPEDNEKIAKNEQFGRGLGRGKR